MSEVAIEVRGLELRGFHGALEEELREGQRFVFDVTLVAHDAAHALTSDTVALIFHVVARPPTVEGDGIDDRRLIGADEHDRRLVGIGSHPL